MSATTFAVLAHQVLVAVKVVATPSYSRPAAILNLPAARALLALAVHRRLEAGRIDRHAALAADVGGQVEREAVGVVQLERGLAVDLRARCRERRLQDLHAVGDGLEEAPPPRLSTSVTRSFRA